MTTRVHHLKLGANPTIVVRFFDPATDAAISLVGASSVTATAKPESGSNVTLTATVSDAANGEVSLNYTTSAFTAAGTYRLEIKFTDAAGKTQIYPPEDGQLRIKVTAANA